VTIVRGVDTSGSTSPFSLATHDPDERTTVVSVEGELDLSTAPRLKWVLTDAHEAGRELILDLSLVNFMDSTALSVLVGIDRRLPEDERLTVVCTNENVLQIFKFSGTDRTFAIHRTLDEALASVQRDHLQGDHPDG
jgi:anti-sigma B factor antagonist